MSLIKRGAVKKCQSKCWSCLLVLLAFYLVGINGQFFTKTSKSIPRMGRRSESSLVEPMSPYRRSLIDALVDEYGPDLLSRLQQARADDTASQAEEFPNGNYQPVGVGSLGEFGLARNERSLAGDRWQKSNKPDTNSLAMRALNADRYIQHLAAGLPPSSFQGLLGNLADRPRTNGSSGNA